jgi:hypothetical protein
MSFVIDIVEENVELVDMYEHVLYLKAMIQHLSFIPSNIGLPTRQRQLELELESLQNFLRLVSIRRGIDEDDEEKEMTPAEELKMELAYGCHDQTDIRLEDTAVAVKVGSSSKRDKKRGHKKQQKQQLVDYSIRAKTDWHTKGQLTVKEDTRFTRMLKKEQLGKWNKQKTLNSKAKELRRFAKYVDSMVELPATDGVEPCDEEEYMAYMDFLHEYDEQIEREEEEEEESAYQKDLAERREQRFQKAAKKVRFQLLA